MLRPNLSMDEPPHTIAVGGSEYAVNADYRVWLLILEMTAQIYREALSPADARHNMKVIFDMEKLAFGGVLADESPYDALEAMTLFLKGYPEPPENGSGGEDERVMSFNYDLNYIILAIRNQGGPDLSYRRKESFHWWEFLLEARSICGEHHVLRLMRIRGYEDDSKKGAGWAHREALRLKRRYALPYEMTADEKRAAEEFDSITGGKQNDDRHVGQ